MEIAGAAHVDVLLTRHDLLDTPSSSLLTKFQHVIAFDEPKLTPRHSTTPLRTLTFIQTPAPPAPDARPKKEPEFVSIHLLLLRLAAQETDLLITINVPHYAGEYVKAGEGENGITQLMRDGEVMKNKLVESFDVKDFGLFQG
jgi:hypothetical protein